MVNQIYIYYIHTFTYPLTVWCLYDSLYGVYMIHCMVSIWFTVWCLYDSLVPLWFCCCQCLYVTVRCCLLMYFVVCCCMWSFSNSWARVRWEGCLMTGRVVVTWGNIWASRLYSQSEYFRHWRYVIPPAQQTQHKQSAAFSFKAIT